MRPQQIRRELQLEGLKRHNVNVECGKFRIACHNVVAEMPIKACVEHKIDMNNACVNCGMDLRMIEAHKMPYSWTDVQ